MPPLFLAVGAVIAGKLLDPLFIGEDWQAFWNGSICNAPANHVLAALEHVPAWREMAPLVVGLLGIALAYVMYIAFPLLPMRLASQFRGIYLFLLNKWCFDELYDVIFVQPMLRLARVIRRQTGDATIIDGVPNGLAELRWTARARR